MVVIVDYLIDRTLKGSRSRSNKLSREESKAEQLAEAEYSLNQDANHTTEQTKLSESFEQTDVIAEGELFFNEKIPQDIIQYKLLLFLYYITNKCQDDYYDIFRG